jgi:hypothetical protein
MRYISGVVLVFAALILMLLGRTEYFGYLEEHYALVSIAGLAMMIAGAWLCGSEYMRNLRK